MNKIKGLLEKAGCNPELVGGICEALDSYKSDLREQFEADYKHRVEQAKKVCIDETESHKRELAKRVQIFCETKAAAIEAQLARQSALSESEAVTRLKGIVSLLEGIEPNGDPSGRATAALEQARRRIQQVNEDRQKALEVANRQTAIAEKALKQNRRLATENTMLMRKVTEAPMVAESRAPNVARSRRIDLNRSASRPVTTRQTLVEHQDRRPPVQNNSNIRSSGPSGNAFGITDIAANMDEDLI